MNKPTYIDLYAVTYSAIKITYGNIDIRTSLAIYFADTLEEATGRGYLNAQKEYPSSEGYENYHALAIKIDSRLIQDSAQAHEK